MMQATLKVLAATAIAVGLLFALGQLGNRTAVDEAAQASDNAGRPVLQLMQDGDEPTAQQQQRMADSYKREWRLRGFAVGDATPATRPAAR